MDIRQEPEEKNNLEQLVRGFVQKLRQDGVREDDAQRYRTRLRPLLRAAQAPQTSACILKIEAALPPQDSALCAMILADDAEALMRSGQHARALSVLKDACSMSARCRDSESMVDATLLLARCFSAVGDEESASRSAALCVRAIQTHFDGAHPLLSKAQAYLHTGTSAWCDAPQQAQDAIFVQETQMQVRFAKREEPNMRRPDADTAFVVAAKNGMLQPDTALDASFTARLSHLREQGEFDRALLLLSRVQEALQKDSAYHDRIALWTARVFQEAGDMQRAVGLYSRIVQRLLDTRGAQDACTLDAMQALAGVYETMGEHARCAALWHVVFQSCRAAEPRDEQALRRAAESYLAALRSAQQWEQLEALCLWCMRHDDADEAVVRPLAALAAHAYAQQDYACVCRLCGALYECCERVGGVFAAALVPLWFAAAVENGVYALALRVFETYPQALLSCADDAVFDAMQRAAQALLKQGKQQEAETLLAVCRAQAADEAAQTGDAAQADEAARADGAAWADEAAQADEATQADEAAWADEAAQADEAARADGAAWADEAAQADEAPEADDVPQADDYDAAAVAAMRDEAAVCAARGQQERALSLRREVLRLRTAHFGPAHPDTLAAMNNLAKSLLHTGRTQDAIQMHKQAVEGYVQAMGAEHPYTLTALENLAHALDTAQAYQDSFQLWHQLYLVRVKQWEKDDPRLVAVMEHMEQAARMAAQQA